MFRTVRSILLSATAVALIGVAVAGAVIGTSAPNPTTSPDPAALWAGDLDVLLAADQPSAKPERAAARGDLRRLAAWRRLVHATVVVDLPKGGLTTIQLDHGSIAAVDPSSLTIAEAGGGSVTVRLGDDTRVRRDGARAKVADLKTGDELFVMSKVESAGTTAYLVVVPKR